MKTCPRCGTEIKGFGKTVYCQPCASHFHGLKVAEKRKNRYISGLSPKNEKSHPHQKKVTLPHIKGFDK
jgi:hypothetical protein